RPLLSTLFPYTTLFRSVPLRFQVALLHVRQELVEPVVAHPRVRRVRDETPAPGAVDARGELEVGVVVVVGGQRPLLEVVGAAHRSEEHTSELQSRENLV